MKLRTLHLHGDDSVKVNAIDVYGGTIFEYDGRLYMSPSKPDQDLYKSESRRLELYDVKRALDNV